MILFLKIYFVVTMVFYVKRTILKVRKSLPAIKNYLSTIKVATKIIGERRLKASWVPPTKPEYMRLLSELEEARNQTDHWKEMYFNALSTISDEDK